jgi:hypothetical protein
MAYSINAKDYFNTTLYTGNASTQSTTGFGFQPDLVWNKGRDTAESWCPWDVIRGVTERVIIDANTAPSTVATGLTSFNSDGWTTGSLSAMNESNKLFVSYNWKGGGTGVSNTNGSTTTTVSSSVSSGCSIVKYTGTGSVATLGHGLSTSPTSIIIRRLNVSDWVVGSNGLPSWNYVLNLNTVSNAADQVNQFNGVTPGTSTFTLGTEGQTNQSGIDYIAYCFSDITGFSQSGSYTGNGNINGVFVYTGFKPAFVLIKRSDSAGDQWQLNDSKRGFNGAIKTLYTDSSEVETSSDPIDLLSNGFKNRATSSARNGSGVAYYYLAFAEAPLVGTNNVPATAR